MAVLYLLAIGTMLLIFVLPMMAQEESKQKPKVDKVAEVRDAIYKAHGAEAWWQKEMVTMDVVVKFGGGVILDAKFYYDPQLGKVRMEMADGSVVIYDEGKTWAKAGAGAKANPGMRFHVLTWPWFAASPFKMKHSVLNKHESLPLRDGDATTYKVLKQTFAEDAGDSPDDWYLIYKDPKDHTMAAQAYIVTYSQDQEKAEASPSIIVYDDYKIIDGVKLSETWNFYFWNKDKGTVGKEKGIAKVSNYAFKKFDASLFKHGDDYVEIAAPK